MFDYVAVDGAVASYGTGNETGLICYRRSCVGDLHSAAIGDGFEEAKKGDLMRGETGTGGGIRPDLGDVQRSAGECCEDEALGEVLVACQFDEFGSRGCHLFLATVSDRTQASSDALRCDAIGFRV